MHGSGENRQWLLLWGITAEAACPPHIWRGFLSIALHPMLVNMRTPDFCWLKRQFWVFFSVVFAYLCPPIFFNFSDFNIFPPRLVSGDTIKPFCEPPLLPCPPRRPVALWRRRPRAESISPSAACSRTCESTPGGIEKLLEKLLVRWILKRAIEKTWDIWIYIYIYIIFIYIYDMMDFKWTFIGLSRDMFAKNMGKWWSSGLGGTQFSDKATWAICVSASLKKDSSWWDLYGESSSKCPQRLCFKMY